MATNSIGINERIKSRKLDPKKNGGYRSLVNNVPGMIYIAWPDWSAEIISNSALVSGYTVEEFKSSKLNWTDLIHQADREQVLQEGKTLTEEPLSIVQEYRIIAKDGNIRWVSDRKSSFFTHDGAFEKIEGVVFDITERKTNEEKLRESEKRFRALFEQAAVGFAQIEMETGAFVRINQRYADIVGYAVDELCKLTEQDITQPEDLRECQINKELLQTGAMREFVMEKRYHHQDGSIVWVNLTASAMWAPGEQPDYYVAVVEDITRRKQAEEELRKFSRAVEQSNSSVMITNTNGIIEYVNPTFTRLSGYVAGEVVGKKPSISKSGKTSGKEYQQLWQVITAGNEWQGEFHNRRKDGSFYWVSSSISPIRNPEGIITHFLAIQEDITEKKRIQDTLSRQNAYLSALHEISVGIISRLNLSDMLQTLIIRAGGLINTPHNYIYLVDEEKNEIECVYGTGMFNQFVGLRLKPGEGMAGKVWQTGRTMVIDNYQIWEGRSPQIPLDSIRSAIGIPLMSGSQVKGVLALAYDFNSDFVFGESEVELLDRLARLVSISIENAYLYAETQRLYKNEQQRTAELATIISVSEAISKNLEVHALSLIVGDMITRIFRSDATAILILDTRTNLLHPLYEYEDGHYVKIVKPFPLGKGLTSWIIQSRQPLLLATADEATEFGVYYPPEMQAINPTVTQSFLGVPILVGEKILGVLAVHSYTQHAFDQNSIRLLSTLASNVGVAFENAQLFDEAQKARLAAESANEKMSRELELAGQVQRSFLPAELPKMDGWQLAVELKPARETSGDFFDIHPLPSKHIGLLMADVVDKGVGAALFMVMTWAFFHMFAEQFPTQPERVLSEVNQLLLHNTHANQFVTVFYGILDPSTGILLYSNAGHPPPILIRAKTGEAIQQLKLDKTRVPLGLFEKETWEQGLVHLEQGDGLVIYTDGVIEAQNASGGFYDMAGLQKVVKDNLESSSPKIISAILDDLQEFIGEMPQVDDIALIAIRRE